MHKRLCHRRKPHSSSTNAISCNELAIPTSNKATPVSNVSIFGFRRIDASVWAQKEMPQRCETVRPSLAHLQQARGRIFSIDQYHRDDLQIRIGLVRSAEVGTERLRVEAVTKKTTCCKEEGGGEGEGELQSAPRPLLVFTYPSL